MSKRIIRNVFITVAGSIAMLLLLSGCSSMFIGSGTVTNQDRAVDEFDRIVFSGAGEVTIKFADRYSVIVTADDNTQQHIKMNAEDGVLTISMDVKTVRATKLSIDITMPTLTAIDMEGAGSITLGDGSADNLAVKLSGVGSIDATRYQIKNASVNLEGVGTLKVWATESLSGKLSGVGQLVYKGSPTLNVDHEGLGNIVRQ
ncbi:DUF2807 domain-containing protein [Clostridia bacterium]|nr:DUF2807 domain-containing protein [Clostridia bacterium]